MPTDPISLYIEHRAPLVDYATRIVGSRAQAEDVVQEAWLRLRQADNQSAVLEPVAYLYRVVRNLAIDARRRLTREFGRSCPDDIASVLPAEEPSAERSAVARDELRLVLEALDALPERTRVAVRLNRIEGKTLQQVADHLDLSVTRTFRLIAEGVAHCDRWRVRAGPGRK